MQHLRIEVLNKGLSALAESAESRMVEAVVTDIMGEQPAIYVKGLWHKTKRILRRSGVCGNSTHWPARRTQGWCGMRLRSVRI